MAAIINFPSTPIPVDPDFLLGGFVLGETTPDTIVVSALQTYIVQNGALPLILPQARTGNADVWPLAKLPLPHFTQNDLDRLNLIHEQSSVTYLDTTLTSGQDGSGNEVGFSDLLEDGSTVAYGALAARTFSVGTANYRIDQLTDTGGQIEIVLVNPDDLTALPANLLPTTELWLTTGGTLRKLRLRDAIRAQENYALNISNAGLVYQWEDAPSGILAANGATSTVQIVNTALPAHNGILLPAFTTADGNKIWRVNAGGTAVDLVDLPASGGGGVTETQVNALILAALPLAKRVPDFAAGDAREVLAVNATGTALQIRPESKDADTLERRAALPSPVGFSAGDLVNVEGTLYELIASNAEANVFTGVATAFARPTGAPAGSTYVGHRSENELQWRTDSGGSSLLIIAKLRKDILTAPPARIMMDFSADNGFVQRDIILTRATLRDTMAGGGMPATAAYIENGDVGLEPAALGAKFSASFYQVGAGDVKGAAINVFPAGPRWELDDRVHPAYASKGEVYAQAQDIIVAGDDISITPDASDETITVAYTGTSVRAFTDLADGSAIGIAVSDGTTTHRNGFQRFDPVFDFDLGNNGHGTIQIEATLQFGSRGDVQIGFDDDTADPLLVSRKSGFTFASDVKAANARSATTLEGVKMFDWAIKKGSADVGTVSLYLVKNAANELGYELSYAPGTNSQSNWDMTLDLNAEFHHYDAGASGGSGLTQAEVDSRIKAGVKDFAETANAAKVERADLAANQQLPAPSANQQVKWNSGATALVNAAPLQSTVEPSKAETAVATDGTVQMDLAADALASGQGISVANHDIVFANAGLYWIDWSIEVEMSANPAVSFGAARTFMDFVWKRTRASVDDDLEYARQTFYSRAMSNATGARTGPDKTRANGSFAFAAQANDRLFLNVMFPFVQSAGSHFTVDGTKSQIAVSSIG